MDVAGCLLFPGFIDAHTHFDLDVGEHHHGGRFLPPAAVRLCGAAPPPSSTSPAPTRGRVCNTVWISGIRKQTAAPSATTAST
ncbi:MAG: hypothetical protein ACLSHO_07850 [Dysosmobacter sp.]